MRILSPCRVQPLQGATREQRKNALRTYLPAGKAVFKTASKRHDQTGKRPVWQTQEWYSDAKLVKPGY
jgi:hypothetical protein